MKWIRKQKYSEGFDSPGSTAGIVAKSYQLQLEMGLSKKECCVEILEQYLDTFSMVGFTIPDTLLNSLRIEINSNIVATTFAIICLSHVPVPGNLEIIERDIDIIIEVIVEKQKAFLQDSTIGYPLPLTQCTNILNYLKLFK